MSLLLKEETMTTITVQEQLDLMDEVENKIREQRENPVVPEGWINNLIVAEKKGITDDAAAKQLAKLWRMGFMEKDYMKWKNTRKPIYRFKQSEGIIV
jgi:hypothetical protein